MQGTILSRRYLIAEEIGIGGMGSVYRATDLRTGGEVAVKIPVTDRDPSAVVEQVEAGRTRRVRKPPDASVWIRAAIQEEAIPFAPAERSVLVQ